MQGDYGTHMRALVIADGSHLCRRARAERGSMSVLHHNKKYRIGWLFGIGQIFKLGL
jgi:hypothetical protein